MKRIISCVLAMVMFLAMLPMPAHASTSTRVSTEEPVISIDNTYGKPGATVEVYVDLKNNPGITSAKLSVSFDSELTLIGAENGNALSALSYMPPNQLENGGTINDNCQFAWFSADIADENIIKNGTILKLTFQVAEEAEVDKTYGVTVFCDDVVDKYLNEFTLQADAGITVIDYMPGDVNNDTTITMLDVILLCRYIVDGCKYDPDGYAVTVNESAANVNDDGKMSMLDVVLLCRYIVDGCTYDPDGYAIKLVPESPKCSHTMEAFAYKAATCTEDGNISYYHCTTCGKYYNDSNGTAEIALANTVLPATGHTAVTDPYVEPTYTSVGWTEGSHCSVCSEVLVAQEEIPALKKDEYYITYNITYNDSYLQSIEIKNPNPSVYTAQDGLRLAEPEVDGYIFEGWYDGQGTSANKITEIAVGTTGNITLYAHWTKVKYTVTFNSPLAETSSKVYTVDTGATLTNPSYYGYTFVGWSDEYGNLISRIPVGSTGNITLTANWTSKRNQTVPVASLSEPLIVEDEENGKLFFTYYIGRMENVPLYTIKDFGYNSGGGITWSETVEYTYSISEENATSVANTIAEATTTTSAWTLSQGWNSITSISESQASSTTAEQMASYSKAFESSGSYSIGSSVGGATSTTTEAGISSKVSATASVKTNVSASLGVEDAGVKAGVEAGVETGYSVTGEVGGSYTETEENSKNWSNSSSYEASKTASSDYSVSSSLSSTISKEYNYGQSYESSEEFEKSNELAVSTSKEAEYGSTFVYATDTATSVTKTYSNEGSTDGYYRLVAAGTIHVFAVVGYDIASSSYFVYTYNVMDDKTYEFMDYSATTQGYDDLQNGILSFEVPYEVNTYVDSLTLTTSGLVVDIETGMITGYNGTADHVMIPEYMTVDNGDGSASVIHIAGIESDAFAGNTSIVEVKFPDTITEIPNGAFKGCTSLTGVVAARITAIGDEAFSGCTALSDFTVSTAVTELGENAFAGVTSIVVTAYDTDVAKTAAASGAISITLNLSSIADALSDYTFIIPEDTGYFAFNGGTKNFTGVQIISNAAETVINGATFTNCQDTPLVISSKNVTLNRVTVETSGLAMQLTADTADVALYGSVNMNTSGSDAVRSNNIVLSLSNSSVSSKMYVTGNVLVCGMVTNEKYLSVSNGEIICYSADDSCVVTFDANGGACSEGTRVIACGSAVGELPTAFNDGYVFYGWSDAGGNVITADTVFYTAGEMTLYAQWIEPYTITWNPGIGYTISVTRTASPNGKAGLGTLNSGDSIYPGDSLTVNYAANTGYSLVETGATEITVTGNLTVSDIFVKAKANSYTYDVVYISSNGADLGSTTVTFEYGTTNTICAPEKAGYDTPANQEVVWDSVAGKTITFTYTPIAVATSQSLASGTWYSAPSAGTGITYSAKAEYQNRTATSVQVRIVWTQTIKKAAFGYNQYFKCTLWHNGTNRGNTGNVKIASTSTWPYDGSTWHSESRTVNSGWITVSLDTTNATTVSVNCDWWTESSSQSGSWSGKNISIPAY